MTDSINDILSNRASGEPTQISALKSYANENHNVQIKVRITPKSYIIEVPNASLANIFRLESAQIAEQCNLDKPLVIHIGY